MAESPKTGDCFRTHLRRSRLFAHTYIQPADWLIMLYVHTFIFMHIVLFLELEEWVLHKSVQSPIAFLLVLLFQKLLEDYISDAKEKIESKAELRDKNIAAAGEYILCIKYTDILYTFSLQRVFIIQKNRSLVFFILSNLTVDNSHEYSENVS